MSLSRVGLSGFMAAVHDTRTPSGWMDGGMDKFTCSRQWPSGIGFVVVFRVSFWDWLSGSLHFKSFGMNLRAPDSGHRVYGSQTRKQLRPLHTEPAVTTKDRPPLSPPGWGWLTLYM
ncbi:hypothetical protein Pcinc_040267 [Petrolisthes cinctipes]|uniref:Uncharacterized protein n=1 Tax=Petrolisthes cinctipes TaxID=88211 RepID=A0AAE1EI70_PETCI|nr:hypothetical protein Pcinc_040267 [Petrolisthes cinctipes]